MAKRRKGRPVNGVLLLDKPHGLSSNHALQTVKRIYFAQKAGHTGALDPLATGMLPICLGEGTKFSQYLLDTDKTYQVTAKLGVRTTTSDAGGEVVSEKAVDVSSEQLAVALESFRGTTQQVPSMYSALKHKGQPLYKYAREGIDVPRESRAITVFNLELLRFEGDEVELSIHVSKGTYIRSLVEDIGNEVGCGAYVSMLHRNKAGPFSEAQMIDYQTLLDLEDNYPVVAERHSVMDEMLIHSAEAIPDWPKIDLTLHEGHKILHGQRVKTSFPHTAQVQLWVNTPDGAVFVGVGDITDNGTLIPKRVFQVTLPKEVAAE